MIIQRKLFIPYDYRTIHQKLLSLIFSVTQGVCYYKIILQYMIHPLPEKVLANLLRAIKQVLKEVQCFHGRQQHTEDDDF